GGSSVVGATFLWTTAIPLATITNDADPLTATGDLPGIYTLTVTDQVNGCTNSATVEIQEDLTAPTITSLVKSSDLDCNNPTIDLTVSSSVGTDTYEWTTATGGFVAGGSEFTATATVNVAADYTIKVTSATTGCTTSQSITVDYYNSKPVINIVPSATKITCAQMTIDLNASTSLNATNYSWSAGSGNIVSGGSTNTATISTAGTYTLIAEHISTGCTETGEVIITDDLVNPIATIIGGPYSITCTDPTEIITATVNVGSTILWTGPGIFANATTLSPTVNLEGTYIITATAANGCSSTDNVLVQLDNSVPNIALVSTSPDDITCTNTSVQISGNSTTPLATYLWQEVSANGVTITNANTPTASVNGNGNFRFTVTAANGCTNSIDVSVAENIVPPTLTLLATDDEELMCNYSTVTLDASSTTPSALYSWSTFIAGATIKNGNSPTPNVDKAGDYEVTVTDLVNGCTTTGITNVNELITVPSSLVIAVPGQITCSNSTVILDASASSADATSFIWTASLGGHILANDNTTTPTVDAAGRYTLTAEHNITGCPTSVFVDVTEDNSVPVIDVFNPSPGAITCSNALVTLSADATGLGLNKTILWTTSDGNISSGATSNSPIVDKAGTYVVTITSTLNFCSTVRSITVIENTTLPTIAIDVPLDITCSRLEVNLNATGTSINSSPLTYSWLAGAGGNIVSGSTTASSVVDAVADYDVTVTDLGNGCVNTSTVSVSNDITPPDVSVDVNPDQITCNAATVFLSGSSTYPNVNYLWTTSGSGTIFNASTITPIVNAAGTYNLTVKNTDNNCTATSSNVIVVEDKVNPIVTVNNPSGELNCAVAQVNISVSQDPNYRYSWSGPGNIITPNSYSTNVEAMGTYTVIVEDINSGCTSNYTVDVIEDNTPDLSPAINDIETCFGTPNPSFTVISGNTVHWYEDATYLSSGLSYTPAVTSEGIHTFYATSTGINGCESLTREVTFTIHGLPTAPNTIGNTICFGSTATELTAIGTNINWYDNTNTFIVTSTTYTPADNLVGTYTYNATQTNANGCESAQNPADYVINGIPAPPSFVNPSIKICENEVNPIFSVVGNNINWYKNIAGAIVGVGNSHQPNETAPGVHTYFSTQTINGCESPEAPGTFTVNAMPIAYNVIGGGAYCEGGLGLDIILSNSETGVNYELWIDDATLITDIPGTTGSSISFGNQMAVGNYTVYAYNVLSLCRYKMNASVDVSINPLPEDAPVISGSIEVCQNELNISYSIDPILDATNYVWSVPAGFTIVSGNNSNSITVNIDNNAISDDITVYAKNACGLGTTSPTLFVNVNPIPGAANNLIGPVPAEICRNEDGVIFSIDADANATHYNWTLPVGASIVAGAGSRQVTLDFDQTAVNDVIMVSAANACGEGAPESQSIIVNSLPYVSALDQEDLCVDNTTLDGNIPAVGSTGTWTTFDGAVTFPNNDPNNPVADITNIGQGNNKLVWTIVDVNGCSLSDTALITNNKVNVEAGDNENLCDESIVLTGSDVPTGANGSWSVLIGAASFSDGNNPVVTASDFDSGINKLKWSVTKGICTNYDTIFINNERPTQADAGWDQPICSDSTILNANNPLIGDGLWSVVSGTAQFEDSTLHNTVVRNLSHGDNVLKWTIKNGSCTIFDEVTITNNQIDVEAGNIQTLCDRTTYLEAIAPSHGIGYWSVLEGSAAFVEGNEYNTRVTGLSKGENILAWNVDIDGCFSVDSVSIINDLPSSAEAGPDQSLTIDITTLQATNPVIGSGYWEVVHGSGSFADDTLYNTSVYDLSIGDNILRWNTKNGSCILSDDVLISNYSSQITDAGPVQTLCSDETVLEGNEPIFGFGEWSVPQGSASFLDYTNPKTPVTELGKGENILRWSVWENGWTYDDVVIINNLPTEANAGEIQSFCQDSTYLAGNEPIVGIGEWSVISGSAYFEFDTLFNTKVTGLGSGENVLKWKIENNGCILTDVVTIINDIPSVANAGKDQTICSDTVTLTPNTPTVGTGEWRVFSGSASFYGNKASDLSVDDNILRWTIVNNSCSLHDDVVITNHRPTEARAGQSKTICHDSIVLAANIPIVGTGTWLTQSGSTDISDVNSSTPTVTNLKEGLNIYRWEISYMACSLHDDVIINNALIQANTGDSLEICDNETILEANNPGAGIGTWSIIGGSGFASFDDLNQPDTKVNGLDKGTNILRWTIVNDICPSYSDVVITNNLPTEANAGPNRGSCSDQDELEANTPIIGIGEWSRLSGSSNIVDIYNPFSSITDLDMGVNTLRWTITNNGCTSIDEVVISNNLTITSDAGRNETLCKDSTVLFANVPNNGIGAWSVLEGSASFDDNGDYNSKIYNIGKGTNVLQWLITNNDCYSSDTVTITNNSPSTAYAGEDFPVCGDSTILSANFPVYGSGNWSLINGAGDFSDKTENNTQVSNLSSGPNTFRWTISNLTCDSYDDVVIDNDLPNVAYAGEDFPICGTNSPLLANNPLTGNGKWSLISGSAIFSDSTRYDAIASDLGFGQNTLRWTITYDRCTTIDEVVVTNNEVEIYAGGDQTVSESNTMLVATNPTSGEGAWSVVGGSGNFSESNNLITEVTGLGSGLNTFRWMVNINDCSSFDDVSVNYNVMPASSFFITETEGCPPLDVFFINNSMAGLPFSWDFDDGTASDQVTIKHTFNEPGIYKPSLTIISENGDIIVKDTIITIYDQPKASFLIVNKQVFIPEEEAIFVNTSTDAITYEWEFGDGGTSTESDPRYIYETEGAYNVILHAWSENDCYDSTNVVAGVEVYESTIVVFPTAFTPNLDGSSGGVYNQNDFSNDVFYPIGDEINNYHLEIFNRWGVLVFESSDINIGWDGYYDNKLLDEGVYVWKVTGKINNGKDFNQVGTIMLLH
ncbi:MAG: PKD domain-containing protein, partial [Bacteroidales bacterium]|nr:PKD domain-containing protein [Bacteroidales bacterium]